LIALLSFYAKFVFEMILFGRDFDLFFPEQNLFVKKMALLPITNNKLWCIVDE